jgi:hypothetical protein
VLKRGFGDFWSGVWKDIRRGWDKFHNFVRFETGVGSKVSFWHDLWCVDRSLKLCYPVLFSIARHKDVRMADNLFVQDGVSQWNVYLACQGSAEGGIFCMDNSIRKNFDA